MDTYVIMFDGTQYVVCFIEDYNDNLKKGYEYITSFSNDDQAFDYASALNKNV